MAYSDRKINKLISIVLGIIAALLVAAAAIIAVKHYWPKKENFSEFKNKPKIVEEALAENPINFTALKEQNEDVCAWIRFDSEDIAIDYPIVRAGEEKKEDYYLRRDLEGNYSTGGTVYIQKMNSEKFTDNCTVVYGHNMRNLTMFGTLKYLREKESFDKNKFFYIYVPGHIYKYTIKSAFVYDDRHIMYSFDFSDTHGFNSFVEEVLNPKSLVKNVREDVVINEDSKLVVLSTCTNVDKERYLVVGVLTEDTNTK